MRALLLSLAALALAPQAAAAEDVIVRYRDATPAETRAELRRAAGAERARALALPDAELLRPAGGVPAREVIARLERSHAVLYAEPDARRTTFATPRDPYFGQQWGLLNTGQAVNRVAGTPGADIRAPEAWDVTTGSASVLVAVADTGVDADHPDLTGNLYSNPGELGKLAGSDDDGNGFVDDLGGWDFVEGDPTPHDRDGHGTHVAGTIAATGDNGDSVTGVAWRTSLLPLRVLGSDGTGTVSDAIDAYRYAALAGAKVINLSLGGYDASQAERDALASIPGVLIVTAAGNDGADVDLDADYRDIDLNGDGAPERVNVADSYPCEYDLPNVLCVAASDQFDGRPAFSNFGTRKVDLAAPGVSVLSTAVGGGTRLQSGTSMAAPHVSGAAALALAARPGLGTSGLRSGLLDTSEPLPAFEGRLASSGRLDLAGLVRGEVRPRPTPTPAATPAPTPAPTPPPPPAPLASTTIADRTPPSLTGLSLSPRRDLLTALRRGIRVRLRCSEACTVRAELRRGRSRLATRTVRREAQSTGAVVLRPSRARARALRSSRRLTLTVRLRITDAAGNWRLATRRLALAL